MQLYKYIIKGYVGHDDDWEHDNFKRIFIVSPNIDSAELIELCFAQINKEMNRPRNIALYCALKEEYKGEEYGNNIKK